MDAASSKASVLIRVHMLLNVMNVFVPEGGPRREATGDHASTGFYGRQATEPPATS